MKIRFKIKKIIINIKKTRSVNVWQPPRIERGDEGNLVGLLIVDRRKTSL